MMEAKNLRYSTRDGDAIDMDINHPAHGWIPFTAASADVEPLGRALFEQAKAGDLGDIDAYVDPEPEPQTADAARAQRDALLSDLDIVVSNPLRWSAFGDKQRSALAAYRQALLDVPQQATFPDKITWPPTPDFL